MPQVVIRDETALSFRRPSLTFSLPRFCHLLTSDKTSILFRSSRLHQRRIRALTPFISKQLSLIYVASSSLKDSFASNSELAANAWYIVTVSFEFNSFMFCSSMNRQKFYFFSQILLILLAYIYSLNGKVYEITMPSDFCSPHIR